MNTETRTHTALHVLKGAAQKVLNASLTTSVYVGGENGRLSIQFNRKPTDEEIAKIENEANNCIERNVEVKTLEMDRPEAEKRFGNIIYDNFSLPESITKLKILYIEDWNANCCIKEHTNTTGEVGKIKIDHWRFRESKQVLEISFKVY